LEAQGKPEDKTGKGKPKTQVENRTWGAQPQDPGTDSVPGPPHVEISVVAGRTVKCLLKTVNLQPMDRFTGIHAVREALEAGSAFDRIVIAKGRQDSRIEEIVQLARARDIPVRFEDRGQLDRLANSKDHQGVVAIAASRPASTLEDILAHANSVKNQAGLIVLLDGVEDPHNLGAVIRTALAAGAHGVVIPERRAAG